METTPIRSWLSLATISSSNVRPYIDSPPVPSPAQASPPKTFTAPRAHGRPHRLLRAAHSQHHMPWSYPTAMRRDAPYGSPVWAMKPGTIRCMKPATATAQRLGNITAGGAAELSAARRERRGPTPRTAGRAQMSLAAHAAYGWRGVWRGAARAGEIKALDGVVARTWMMIPS